MKHNLNSNLVLIENDQPEEKDQHGIFVQEEWQTLPPTGTVLAVGEGVTFCKEGDRVFYERYSAIQTPHGKDIKLVRADAIFEVIK